MLQTISKAIAGGLGAALAKTVLIFLPDLDLETRHAVEYVIYTVLTGLAVYLAPANVPALTRK